MNRTYYTTRIFWDGMGLDGTPHFGSSHRQRSCHRSHDVDDKKNWMRESIGFI
jgi:hypothetical protein